MKIKLKTEVRGQRSEVRILASGFRFPTSGLRPPASERGIALVITLILLSVTLVMAVAFLAISNRERSSVTTTTDATTARLAAETALAQAESQIVSTMLATTNPYNYGLIVSTNYINPAGFDPSVVGNPTNVNYDYQINSTTPLTAAQLQQNIANLYFSPRVPVYIATNGGTDFRFYLDLNRNGRFDTNNFPPGADTANAGPTGDPEWVGVLERPDTTHGPNNKFLSRYAFIAVPVGNTLDINYIHNQARSMTVNPAAGGQDGFLRNQGVGSWEINLAAFLTDLNTNVWLPVLLSDPASPNFYAYNEPNNFNGGRAFDDARALLSYRYNFNYNNLATVNGLYGVNAAAFQDDGIDEYSDGRLQTTINTNADFIFDDTTKSWAGADNINYYFTTQDLFDPAKTEFGITPPGFIEHLQQASTNVSAYDRYTFYRMLSQLGTDSTPESGLMNLNYDNLTPTNGVAATTNFMAWQPITFFTNAADRMLRLYTTNWFQAGPSNYLATYYGVIYTNPITIDQFSEVNGLTNAPFFGMTNQIPAFGIGNIPVLLYGNFMYPPAVQRVLQLAANIYDATTNNAFALGKDFPSVFRPTFLVTNEFGYKNVYINGYEYVGVINSGDLRLSLPTDAANLSLGASVVNYPNGVNVYGVPWIIGAKKGFPSFNEFSMESVIQVTRKLELSRATNATGTAHLTGTNQMYAFSITNSLGVECWNSYTNGYSNTVQIVVRDNVLMTLTNGALNISSNYFISVFTNVVIWPGSTWVANALSQNPLIPNPLITFQTNVVFMPESIYRFSPAQFVPEDVTPPPAWDTNNPATLLPQFGLQATNRLQVFMLDTTGSHIIDYVQFSGPNSSRNVNAELADPNSTGVPAYLWSTNLYGSSFVPYGVVNQINVSSGQSPLVTVTNGGAWLTAAPPGYPGALRLIPSDEAAFFHGFLVPNSIYTAEGRNWTNASLVTQAPYTPTRIMVQYTSWQANDPLVHYIASDLNFSGTEQPSALSTGTQKWYGPAPLPILPDIGQLNVRYAPWGTASFMADIDTNAFNLAYKDPLIWQSDDWDFPTNKLPGVGWLGRVHRGTPWQTVYLKSSGVNFNTWTNWTGDLNDAGNMVPGSDRLLFDVFTAAPNDNATRGQLSVNVGSAPGGRSLAAWSALFSGMVVLTNTTVSPNQFTQPSNSWMIIAPVGVDSASSPLWQVVTNINNTRENTNLFPQQIFAHKGDILATPQLTVQSPFLNTNTVAGGNQLDYGISDEMYEWLPQQAMSLLRGPSAPRYVIYCYGQALKPAPNSIVTSSGPFFQMCTNYQVVTESAARAVIRVEGANTPSPHILIESFNLLPPD